MPTLELNGETIAFERVGVGPPVLLLHSLGTHGALWNSTVAALSDRFELVTMDCRGHGGSSNRGGFSIEVIARDGLALMSALAHERFHLVGSSMGGLFAVTIQTLAPNRCLSLSLVGSYATVGAAGPPRIAATREMLASISMAEFGRRYAADTVLAEDSENARLVENAIAAMTVNDYMQTLEAILTADVSPLFGRINVPTLILVGSMDHRAPPTIARTLADSIHGAQYKELTDAGHLPMLDQPELFDQCLGKFLASQRIL